MVHLIEVSSHQFLQAVMFNVRLMARQVYLEHVLCLSNILCGALFMEHFVELFALGRINHVLGIEVCCGFYLKLFAADSALKHASS